MPSATTLDLRRRLDNALGASNENTKLLYAIGIILCHCHERLTQIDANVRGQRRLESMLDENKDLMTTLVEIFENTTPTMSKPPPQTRRARA